MRRDICIYVQDCLVCARSKPNHHPAYAPLTMIAAKGLRDLVAVDIVGKLPMSGNRFCYVLTCLDLYSRYLVTYPLRNASAKTNKLFGTIFYSFRGATCYIG